MDDQTCDFPCPACRATQHAPVMSAGTKGVCTACGAEFVVPAQFDEDTSGAPMSNEDVVAVAAVAPPPAPAPAPANRPARRTGLIIAAAVVVVALLVAGVAALAGGRPAEPPTADAAAAAGTDPALERMRADNERLRQEKAALMQPGRVAAAPAAPAVAAARPPTTAPSSPPSATPAASAAPAAPAAEPLNPQVVVVRSKTRNGERVGCGFVLGNGTLVMSYRVVAGADTVEMELYDRREKVAIRAVDADNDLVVADMGWSLKGLVRALSDGDPGQDLAGPAFLLEVDAISQQPVRHPGRLQVADGATAIFTATSAAAPPRSGAPIVDAADRLLAMVSVQADGRVTTIPAAAIRACYQQRDTTFKLKDTLVDFEAIRAMQQYTDVLPTNGVAVDLLVDNLTGLLVAAVPERNKIVILDPGTKTAVAELFVGTDPKRLRLAAPGAVWASSSSTGKISLIDLKRRVVSQEISLPASPKDFIVAKGQIWYLTDGGRLRVYLPGTGNGQDQETDLQSNFIAYDPVGDVVWLAETSWLRSVNRLQYLKWCTDSEALKAERALLDSGKVRPPDPAMANTELQAREDRLTKARSASTTEYDRPPGVSSSGYFGPPVLARGRARTCVLFDGWWMDAANPISTIACGFLIGPSFELPLQSARESNKYDAPLAISPDGTLLTNGSAVFRADDRSLVQWLLTPSMTMAFAGDSRTLFVSDDRNRRIARFVIRSDPDRPLVSPLEVPPAAPPHPAHCKAFSAKRSELEGLRSALLKATKTQSEIQAGTYTIKLAGERTPPPAKYSKAQNDAAARDLANVKTSIASAWRELQGSIIACQADAPGPATTTWFLNELQEDVLRLLAHGKAIRKRHDAAEAALRKILQEQSAAVAQRMAPPRQAEFVRRAEEARQTINDIETERRLHEGWIDSYDMRVSSLRVFLLSPDRPLKF